MTRSISSSSVAPLRILCVGDSITQGGRNDREEHSYRLPLQRLLHAAGIAFEFVGSQHHGLHSDATWPELAPGIPFDPHHEGYYGHRTANVLRKVTDAWMPGAPAPDVVLIHLGTNDQENFPHASTVQAPLREFIAFLRHKNPAVAILLGHLNFNLSEGASAIRPLVQSLADELNRPEAPIQTIPHYKGWNENPASSGADTFDWSHPNPQGQQKMAVRWFASLRPLLSKEWSAGNSCNSTATAGTGSKMGRL